VNPLTESAKPQWLLPILGMVVANIGDGSCQYSQSIWVSGAEANLERNPTCLEPMTTQYQYPLLNMETTLTSA